MKLHFIQRYEPTQNAFLKPFNANFGYTVLNQRWFPNLADIQLNINALRNHYNQIRRRSGLNYQHRLCSPEWPDMIDLPQPNWTSYEGKVNANYGL